MKEEMKYTFAEIGARLKSVRLDLNLSQEEMGKRLKISRRGWQDFEMGKNMPGGAVLMALHGLGISIDWVLSGQGLKDVEEIEKRINQIAYDQDRMFFIALACESYFEQNHRTVNIRARILASLYQYTAGLKYDERAENQSFFNKEILQQLKYLDSYG